MPKDKHVKPHRHRGYRCTFQADLTNNKIICHRTALDSTQPDCNPVIYSQNGIKPHLQHLTEAELNSWKSACAVLNWSTTTGTPRDQSRQAKAKREARFNRELTDGVL